jgi:hypothetical protein
MRDGELIGAWTLESYREYDGDGALGEGPLGPDPTGLLIYAAQGAMSVSMMRSDGVEPTFRGYAGTWRLTDDSVIHSVTVSSHAYLLDTDQIRRCSLVGDVLTLSGAATVEGRVRRGLLTWRRVRPEPTPDGASR